MRCRRGEVRGCPMSDCPMKSRQDRRSAPNYPTLQKRRAAFVRTPRIRRTAGLVLTIKHHRCPPTPIWQQITEATRSNRPPSFRVFHIR
jgi:hypothetical protein